MKKIELKENAKVNIKWKVSPLDYDRIKEDNIKATFAKKYNIPSENITLSPSFINISEDGEEIPYTTDIVENIQEPKFQQELMKKLIVEKKIENCDFDRIIEIDELINNGIDYEIYEKHKKYTINWIKWKNFMSYGPDNFIDLTKLNGLVLLSSEPANQGGKSTFCLDLFRFLLFGKVTSREDDWTLSKAFNSHLPEATEMVVEGSITIDGIEYIINRTLTRPPLNKRTEKSRITQSIKYYKKVNDELLSLEDEDNQGESSNTETNQAIKEAIGNEKDFDLMICINSRNLEGLISLKDAERGRLISRWIGLLPLEEKEKLARETFNKTVNPKLLLNKINKETLKETVVNLTNEDKEIEKNIQSKNELIKESEKKIEGFTQERETLIQSKKEIDQDLMKVDVVTVNASIERIKDDGLKKKNEKERNEKAYKELGDVIFDETHYNVVAKEREQYLIDVNTGITRCKQIKKEIEGLKKGEYCPTCGAKLKDVDNSAIISNKEKEYSALVEEGKENRVKLDNLTKEVEALKEAQKKYNEKVKLQLIIEKNEVDIENLRSQLREQMRLLKDIEKNKEAIETNNKIEISLNNVKVNIDTEKRYHDRLVNENNSLNSTLTFNKKNIEECNRNIKIIEEEEKVVYHWKLYIEMIGKNGISKMVLRNVLPIINGSLNYLLNDVCDFKIEVGIDDHNDVAFYHIHDGVRSNLAACSGFEKTVASLALRTVLSKISTFSKPSFIVFDEILGGVADENYDNIKLLYDKILPDYHTIIQITHLKQIADWHDNNLIVKKTNNISTIETV